MTSVLILTTSEGHLSLGQAAEAALTAAGISTRLVTIPEPLLKIYAWLYQRDPRWFSIVYYLMQTRPGGVLASLNSHHHDWAIEQLLAEHQPQVVISTSFGFGPVLRRIRRKHKQSDANARKANRHSIGTQVKTGSTASHNFTFINIVANLTTMYRQDVVVNAMTNCVFDEAVARAAQQINPQADTTVTGWFVRPEFKPVSAPERSKLRRQLGLKPEVTTVLMTTGSEGTSVVLPILRGLVSAYGGSATGDVVSGDGASLSTTQVSAQSPVQAPAQVVVACGNNRTLYRQVGRLNERLQTQARQQDASRPQIQAEHQVRLNIVPLPFTDQLHQYVQAADLVAGKAGPNMLFEAAAVQRPFLATTHVAGLEEGSLEVITRYGLGMIEEQPDKADRLLLDIFDRPAQLQQFQPALAKVARYNRQAGDKLVELVSGLLSGGS